MQYKICRKHLSRKSEPYFYSKKDVPEKMGAWSIAPVEMDQQGAIDSNKRLNNNRSHRATKYWAKIGRYHDWGKPRIKALDAMFGSCEDG